MPNFHKFTIKAQEALQNSQELVMRMNHGELKAPHLLFTLLLDEQTLVRPILLEANINIIKLQKELETELSRLPKIFNSGSKTIIAVNKDSEANIFKEAQFGVVGDWKKVIPAFTEKVKQLLSG